MPRATHFTSAVPPAPTPTAPRRATSAVRPKLMGWDVELMSTMQANLIEIDGAAARFFMHPLTWKWFQVSAAGIRDLIHEQAEAARRLSVTLWNVEKYNPHLQAPKIPPMKGRGYVQPKGDGGISTLAKEVAGLVQAMATAPQATQEQQTEFARRYGALRDRMADLRKAFSEAEGAFETAQELLVAQMEQSDEASG